MMRYMSEEMNRIVINADDCGKSAEVNEAIESCIIDKIVTSTTVMANMEGFDGAIDLYKKYSKTISFGLHLNLDEGMPLNKNELLINKGLYKKEGEEIKMCIPHLWKPANKEIYAALYNEMEAQLLKLIDNGVSVSHIDSHHHIHTAPFILPIVIKLAKNYNIRHIRGIRNFYPLSINECLRYGWKTYAKCLYGKCKMTDYFCSVTEFLQSNYNVKNSSIELMCHPGHPKQSFVDEVRLLKQFVVANGGHTKTAELITYKDI